MVVRKQFRFFCQILGHRPLRREAQNELLTPLLTQMLMHYLKIDQMGFKMSHWSRSEVECLASDTRLLDCLIRQRF